MGPHSSWFCLGGAFFSHASAVIPADLFMGNNLEFSNAITSMSARGQLRTTPARPASPKVPRHRIAQASHNHSGKRLLLAVRSSLKIDAATIPDADLLIGGFPCQGFSVANMNRRTGDKRNLLYQQFLLTAQCQLQLRVAKCSTLLD